jgi:hypothetical protein
MQILGVGARRVSTSGRDARDVSHHFGYPRLPRDHVRCHLQAAGLQHDLQPAGQGYAAGPTAAGSFVQTLVLTDIATGWTECAPLLVREQRLLTEVLDEVRKLLPFPLLGFDTDNDSVFMNETVRDYCRTGRITFTRCRPYQKNDQAWVEQKNGTVVRRIVGYRRFAGLEAAALAQLYGSVRLFVNFFQPSFKLAEKSRDGAKIRKSYHPPATPCQRLMANARVSDEAKRQVKMQHDRLDPVRLLREIRAGQRRLKIADAPETATAIEEPTLEQFLSGLRIAWKGGEVRPTARPKAPAKRTRRITSDPFRSCPVTWCRSVAPRRIGSPDQTAIAGRLTTAVSLTVPSVSSVM